MSSSIEALLEAAKYVEQKVDTAASTNAPPRFHARAHRNETQTTGRAVQSSLEHATAGGSAKMAADHSKAVSHPHTVPTERQTERLQVGIEKPMFHFYQPLKTATPEGRGIEEQSLHEPELPMESRTVQAPTPASHDTASYTKILDKPGLQPQLPKSQQALSDTKFDQGAQHVMRHPGYDVSWSYSAPEVRAPASPPDKDRGDPETQGEPKNDEMVTSEDGDESKRSGGREVHNKLEKNRRAHLKDCFDDLQGKIPTLQDRKIKISNSNILSGACRYIGALKRKEKELEHELDWLVREKIRKQKLLHRLKAEKGKNLHVGMPWHQEGSVLTSDLLQQVARQCKVEHERDEEDRYSTSTASEAEEEERKSHVETAQGVTTLVTMTTTLTSMQASSCSTVTSASSETMTSHVHPLKKYLLREHRAQEAMRATTVPAELPVQTPTTVMADDSRPTTVTVVPHMPISPSARPTVSQLLGKQSTPVRQPVRKQTPSHAIPTVLGPVGYPVQRYQIPVQSYIQQTVRQGEIAVRPSQPVVTIGVTPTHPPRSEAKPYQDPLSPVISQMVKLSNGQLINTAPHPGHAVSIVSTSIPTAYLHTTFPGFPAAALTQQIMSPITLPTAPVKQVLVGNRNLTGYATVPGLPQSLIGPFTSNTPTLVSPLLTNFTQMNTLTTVYPNPLAGAPPQRTLGVSVEGAFLTGHPVTTAATTEVASHHLTTVPVLNPRSLPHALPKNRKSTNPAKPVLRNVLPARTKPPLTTAQMAKTFMVKAETFTTVTR